MPISRWKMKKTVYFSIKLIRQKEYQEDPNYTVLPELYKNRSPRQFKRIPMYTLYKHWLYEVLNVHQFRGNLFYPQLYSLVPLGPALFTMEQKSMRSTWFWQLNWVHWTVKYLGILTIRTFPFLRYMQRIFLPRQGWLCCMEAGRGQAGPRLHARLHLRQSHAQQAQLRWTGHRYTFITLGELIFGNILRGRPNSQSE